MFSGGQLAGVQVERLARGVVVVRVVHAAGDGGVVVAEDGERGELADQVAALVGRRAVADVSPRQTYLSMRSDLYASSTAVSASMFAWTSEKIPIRMYGAVR